MQIILARLASFGYLGLISDPLIVFKFHNETHDPKGQENKVYTIVKGRETFYHRHIVPITSCSEVKCVLKRLSFGSKECTKKLKQECKFSGPHQLPSNTVQWTHDSYVLIIRLKKRVRLFEEGATMQRIYIHGVFPTIKIYLLSLYCVTVLKPFCISHIRLGPLS